MKSKLLINIFMLSAITACSTVGLNTATKNTDTLIDNAKWTQWQCKDGSHIRTRYKDREHRILEFSYQGSEHVLLKQKNTRPIIFQDSRIAFFTDGSSAVIGKPNSNLIYNSGCKVIR